LKAARIDAIDRLAELHQRSVGLDAVAMLAKMLPHQIKQKRVSPGQEPSDDGFCC
jgi:hypothetical protein